MTEIFLSLLLLVIANGAPIVASKLLKNSFNHPIDANLLFLDGKPLLGSSKTIRGVIAAIAMTAAASWAVGPGALFGALFGLYAMAGDLLSSFIKRRLSLAPSAMALGIDQIPEALIPILLVRQDLALSWPEITIVVCSFTVIELLLSKVLYKLRIRKQPY